MIIIEGPDATGKSTLARHIAAHLPLTIQESEGPPRDADEITDRIYRYYSLPLHTLFVRHPCVSNPIYDIGRTDPTPIPSHILTEFYAHDHFFIYCHPTNIDQALSHHVLKPTDSEAHQELVRAHYRTHALHYRLWALNHAHVIYRIGDSPERIASIIAALI